MCDKRFLSRAMLYGLNEYELANLLILNVIS